jgi:predicted short-subunit dehydrogenase-like oxidoreductase (DUF2520 family)
VSERIAIVGTGRMGLALGAALVQVDAVSRLVYFGRALEPPPHPLFEPVANDAPEGLLEEPIQYRLGPEVPPEGTTILILAVPDAKLGEVAHEYAMQGPAPAGCVALHLAGALSTDALTPLHGAGYAVGSMHPLQAVADPWTGGDRLVGSAFAIGGEPAAVTAARRIVHELAGRPIVVPPALRSLYHAGAVVASNYLVALTALAARIMIDAGVSEEDALPALLPLMRGTLDNIEHLGVVAALTGPIVRGDADTVRLHLRRLSDEDRAVYSALGIETLRLARGAGLDETRASEIEALLSPAPVAARPG